MAAERQHLLRTAPRRAAEQRGGRALPNQGYSAGELPQKQPFLQHHAHELTFGSYVQIVDESKGPSTKRDYDIATVPVGSRLTGQSTDFLGRTAGSTAQLGSDAVLPIFNQQVSVDDREQIAESLLTGVKVRQSYCFCKQPAVSGFPVGSPLGHLTLRMLPL